MRYLAFLTFLTLAGCGDTLPNIDSIPVTIVPKQLLVIGDSISLGYTPFLQVSGYTIQHDWDHLGGNGNADATYFGLNMIDEWLSARDWDVVTFNWGIHDFGIQGGVGTKPNTSVNDYRANLTILATKIKAKSRRCFFITTTDIPANVPVVNPKDYRAVALEVMANVGIEVIDLLPTSENVRFEHLDFDSQTNEHYTQTGYKALADFINESLEKNLTR